MKLRYFTLCAIAMGIVPMAMAQTVSEGDTIAKRIFMGDTVDAVAAKPMEYVKKDNWFSKARLNGSIQTDFLIPQEDAAIGTGEYSDPVLNNTYFDLTFNAPHISVGARLQVTQWPLPGYENDFKGWGVPYIWATGSYKWAQLTVGDFYQQCSRTTTIDVTIIGIWVIILSCKFCKNAEIVDTEFHSSIKSSNIVRKV